MDRKTFIEVVEKVPLLTADGLMQMDRAGFAAKRHDFVTDVLYLEETLDALRYLQKIGKSERFSEFQRSHCTPAALQDLLAWKVGRPVSLGSIIAAALSLGFTMGVHEGDCVYFNFLAPQIETDLSHLRSHQQIISVPTV